MLRMSLIIMITRMLMLMIIDDDDKERDTLLYPLHDQGSRASQFV